ncbi:MAG: Ku protein [Gammaproteobacteria bacterium]|nr:Ku protein [Gammaproteobacteria bacterium]MBI5616753.1 Ku protein [Gammaproteobacteria bacterium]
MATRRRKPAAKKAPRAAPQTAARRPSWSGQIRLSLVAVPVLLYSAIKSGARLTFHQVHGPSGKRIRYEKVAPGIGPVDNSEILKGYEVSKGHYVLLEEAELDAVKLEAKRTFELVQFVDHGEIDPIYFDQPYYAAPDGDLAEDAYRVLRDALRESGKLGLGQLVMRGREYVCALKPCGDGLLMETLRFADEVRAAAPVFAAIADERSDRELVGLARELIRRKSAPFDPAAFEDRYTEALRALVAAKAKHQRPVEVDEEEEPAGAEIIDLVAALKKSVGAPAKAGRRRKAAS